MSPKWFHRVRELFHDGFVVRLGEPAQATGPPGCAGVKSLRELGEKGGRLAVFCWPWPALHSGVGRIPRARIKRTESLSLSRPPPRQVGCSGADHGAAVGDGVMELFERKPDHG